ETTEQHRFIMPVSAGLPADGQVCLWVGGTQIDSTLGTAKPVAGGDACRIKQPDWLTATMPAWWGKLMLLPVWLPDPAPDGIIENAIVAHVNALADRVQTNESATNTLIHFTGEQIDAPLDVVSQALLATRHRDAPLSVILIVPRGAFAQTCAAL